MLPSELRGRRLTILTFLVAGPGLVVMLADTDAGSLITAAQSGSRWGYQMVLPLLALIPVLYVVQEMTVRLGVLTQKGHGALILQHFGKRWALLSAFTLFACCVGALLTEFAGIAGVGELFGIPRTLSVPVATAFLIGIAVTGSYQRVERIGIALGLAELIFIPAVIMAHPHLSSLGRGLRDVPLGNGSFVLLLAANVGAVIMPWMIFYQQGAVVDKGIAPCDISRERRCTALGALLTQFIMICVVVLFAATVGRLHPHMSITSVGQMSSALQPFLGAVGAKVLLGAAVLGAALVAALVVSLAGAWGISEVFGWKHTLNERPNAKSAKFYVTYCMAHVLGAVIVMMSMNLINLVIDVEVMNTLLLPIVLGLLLALEARALPNEQRMHGSRRLLTTSLCLIVMVFGLVLVPTTLGWL